MLNQLNDKDEQLAETEARLAEQDARLIKRDETIRRYRIREEQLTHEIALLKRHRFGKRGGAYLRADPTKRCGTRNYKLFYIYGVLMTLGWTVC